jgi:putative transposase
MLGAILHVLPTGPQWNALPREIRASTTVDHRFRAWEREGFFARLCAVGLAEYDGLVGLDGVWLSLDGILTKAPFGGAATGANPPDRGKRRTKRSTLCEGHGLPLAVVVAGANVPDMKLTARTCNALVIVPPPARQPPSQLCLDTGYNDDLARHAATVRGYTMHRRTRGEERSAVPKGDPTKRPRLRRWVVERWHSWLNRSRRLLAAGSSWSAPLWPSCSSPVHSSVSSSVFAFERREVVTVW